MSHNHTAFWGGIVCANVWLSTGNWWAWGAWMAYAALVAARYIIIAITKEQTMNLTIYGLDKAIREPDVLLAALRRAANYQHAAEISLFTSDRGNCWSPDFLEWIMLVEFETGGKMTVGVVQRTHGGEVEFHT